jgi:hypothetical protein
MAAPEATGQPRAGGRVFLSHSGMDEAAARELAEVLRRSGIEVWFNDIQAGGRWMSDLEKAIRESFAMIVYIGRLGVQAWVDREVRFGLVLNTESPDRFRLIPVLGEGADPAALPPFLSQQQFVDLRNKSEWPREIQRLIEALRSPADSEAQPFPDRYWDTHSPFRGLTVFEPEDSWLFFGRDTETEKLLGLLESTPVLAVLGSSGSGKSSLIRAGLVPALRHGRFPKGGSGSWRVAVFRPSNDPFDELAESLPGQLAPEMSAAGRMEFIERCKTQFPTGGGALRSAIAAVANGSRTLLIADQFEEIFTLTTDSGVRSRYINTLVEAARIEGATPAYLVLSIRADFYAQCLDHPKLLELLESHAYNVPRMDAPQLRDAIEQRLRLAAARAEPGLIDSLLADVGMEPGNLALLEHTLGQLWNRRGTDGVLTNRSYTEIGRLQGALGQHADEVVRDIRQEALRRLVPRIFLDLVQLGEGGQDTRRRVHKEKLFRHGKPEQVGQLLDQLAASRLILLGEDYVEVSHEALIREWPRLREWLAVNREEIRLERSLSDAAEEWAAHQRDSSYLWQGARLAQAEDWLAKQPEAHAPLAEFVSGCRKAIRERERLIRKLAYVLAGVSIVALAAAAVAWQETLRVRGEQATASSLGMASLSENVRGPDLRLLIALQAVAYQDTREAERALHTAVQNLRGPRFYSPGRNYIVKRMEFSRDSKLLVTANTNGTIALWNAQDGTPAAPAVSMVTGVESLALRADGAIAVATVGSSVRIIDSAGRLLQPELPLVAGELKSVAFSPDGAALAAGAQDGSVFVYSGRTLRLAEHSRPVTALAFLPKGGQLVSASVDGTALGWDTHTGQRVFKLESEGNPPLLSLAIHPAGTIAAAGDAAGIIHIWEIPSGRKIGEWEHTQLKKVEDLAFSGDGRTLASAGQDATIKLWDVAGSGAIVERLAIPCGEGDTAEGCTAVAFMSDGHTLGAAGRNGEIRLFESVFDRLLEQARGYLDVTQIAPEDCRRYLRQSECAVPREFHVAR